MDYLLDTNHVVRLLAGVETLARKVQRAEAGGASFAVATTVLGELYFGAYASLRRDENLSRLEDFLMDVFIYDFDRNAAREFGILQAEQRGRGKPIPQSDAHIAAVARCHQLVLLTEDQHFSLVDGLAVENWLV